MKKPTPPEQKNVRPPLAEGAGKPKVPARAPGRGPSLSSPRKAKPVVRLPEPATDHEARTVRFEYFSPAAQEVFLVGTFNFWEPQAAPMTRQRGGRWTTELLLGPGEYEYRFIVDGHWLEDPLSARFAVNPFGGLNSVLEVKPADQPGERRA